MSVCSVFLIIVIMCGAGDARKIVTFVPNCQLFRTKVQLFIQKFTSSCARTKQQQQKQNRCASDQPWQRSFWPDATTNQQSGGTSLTYKIIANGLCNFILVDCYLATFFSNLVKLPHHGHVDHDNRDFKAAVQAILPRPLG
jgi:hypothetical protein